MESVVHFEQATRAKYPICPADVAGVLYILTIVKASSRRYIVLISYSICFPTFPQIIFNKPGIKTLVILSLDGST